MVNDEWELTGSEVATIAKGTFEAQKREIDKLKLWLGRADTAVAFALNELRNGNYIEARGRLIVFQEMRERDSGRPG